MRALFLLLLLTPATLQAEMPLGRLFLTPENRLSLDRQRWSNPHYTPAASELPPPMRIDGELRTANTNSRIWINGQIQKSGTEKPAPLPAGTLISPATGARQRPFAIQPGAGK